MALRTIRLFISSPGDVAEERLIARRLIGRLDAQFGGALQFEAILWERAPLVSTASFQEQLIKPSDTDVVIVILWSRLGTPLPANITRPDGTTYASGTEFEFEDAILSFRRHGRPRVLTYFKTAPITPSGDLESLEEAARQKRAMDRFVTTWFRNDDGTLKGAFHNFAAPADFEELLEAHLTQLGEEFMPAGVAVRGTSPTWLGRSPFRGLQVFEPEHAPVFFGRTAATATVLAKLRAQGQAGRAFVLIVSMSGAGKSSLIRAGVLPLLLQPGVVGTATTWRHAVMRPGDGQGRLVHPLMLAVLQATALDGTSPETESDPSTDDFVATTMARLQRIAQATPTDADGPPSCHLALVVDQLEEVFSDDRIAPAEREAFFHAIDALARSGVVWILSSMRSDAYDRIADSPTLVALKEGEGQFDLLPPGLREIGQIIRLPAAAAGLRFETRPNTAEKLDDVIRDAGARNPGALPLLQFLLEELYQRRNADDVLTFKAYDELGGVEGALANHAEKVVAGVSDAARKSLPAVLRELVTFGVDDESRALRRVAPRAAFTTAGAVEVIDALLEARLLVSGSGDDGAAVVSLAHEALLEFWPRMKAWVDEDRQLLVNHARLEAATREWEKNRRSPDLLLQRGKQLAEASELANAGIRLSDAELALLAASRRRARVFAMARAGAITGLAVLAVVAGIAAYRARVESERAHVQATTAQKTTDFMVSLFSNADPFQSNGEKVTVREVLDRGVEQIDRELAGEPKVRANLLRAMGQAYSGLGLLDRGRAALQTSGSLTATNDEDAFKTRLALAENEYLDGKYADAEALYRTSVEQATRLHGDGSDAVAMAETGLGETLRKQDRFDEAELHLTRALQINERRYGERSPEAIRDIEALGLLKAATRHFEDAQQLLDRNVALTKEVYGAASAKTGIALGNLGLFYFQQGKYPLAMESWRASLAIEEQLLGHDHEEVGLLLNNLGRVELLTNQLDAAETHLSQSLRIFRASLSGGHEDLVPPLNSLGMIHLARQDPRAAAPFLDEALQLARLRKHRFLDQVLGNVADLDSDLNRPDEAVARLAEARAIQKNVFGDSLDTTESWRSAVLDVTEAKIAARAGNRNRARSLLSDSLPLLRKRFGSGNIYEREIDRISSDFALNHES